MRFRNIEFRWSTYNKKHELVKWYKLKVDGCEEERNYCYVVAFFDKTNSGWDMRTVGDRFFTELATLSAPASRNLAKRSSTLVFFRVGSGS